MYFAGAYPARSIFMVLSLFVAGILEGVGIMALLPLVSILTDQDTLGSGVVLEVLTYIFQTLNIDISVVSILVFITTMIFLKSLITMLALMQVAYSSAHVSTDLRLTYLRKILQSSWLHFTTLKGGASANALGTEASRASLAFNQGCYALSWAIQVMVYAVLAFLISWKLTISAVFAGGLMVMLLSFLVRIGRRAGSDQTKVLDSVLSRITDTLAGAKPLKAMGKVDRLLSIMEDEAVTLQSAQRNMDMSRHAVRVLSEPIMVLFVAIGMYAILTFGDLPIAELMFMALLFLRMITKVTAVQGAYLSMAANESALWSLKDKIDLASRSSDIGQGAGSVNLNQSLCLNDISFSYDENPIFQNLSLELPAKGFFVFFGPSGVGKTTLLDLIIGLHKPSSGKVLIDGQDLSSLNMDQWRKRIGYVPQDVLLFHDTIANNLALNDSDVTEEHIIEALKLADAYDFISNMEHGINTIAGERGAKISGGQRQRIAIARALIAQPSLLILDEATSALDKDTEREILKTIKGLSKNILVLSISHNPSSLGMADKAFNLKDGAVVPITDKEIKRLSA